MRIEAIVIALCCLQQSLFAFGIGGEGHSAKQVAALGASIVSSGQNGSRVYDVVDFGAIGDGKTLNTSAIQSAIDSCYVDSGGTVLVPAGDFITGTLELKDNVTLTIAASGRLLGSGNIGDYYRGKGVPPGNGNYSLIYAAHAHNVAIDGNGTIDGQGQLFYNGLGDGTGPGQHSGNMDRPHLIIFYGCTNVFVHDIFLTRSAYHCMRILECSYVKLEGITILNRVNKNNDGFHFGSSEYVNISNCNVKCQDDACALFGSNKFVTVTNCTFSTRWSVFRFGGGEPGNITVSNCVIYETYGCPIKMRFGRGDRAENISFSNLILNKVTGPISIGLDSKPRPDRSGKINVSPKGIVKNIFFNGIYATVVDTPLQQQDMPFRPGIWKGELRQCIVLNGVGESFLENISLTDIHVTYEGGGTADEADVRDVPEIAGEYFQVGTPPAYGMYARNVSGLSLQNVSFTYTNPDVRPAVILDDVDNAALSNLTVEGNKEAESTLRIINSKDILLSGLRLLNPAKVFLQVEGEKNRGITIDGGDVSSAKQILSFARGADQKAVKLHN
ncbi:MAG TPA: glycosyl hydrolase family 28 protein [Bacteroidota bacterium]|nr:glycosyl hydrolase family 28 protein [Bacteroidota bacterium]